jgi:O-antigen ligase
LLSARNAWPLTAYWTGLWNLALLPLLGAGLLYMFRATPRTRLLSALFAGGVAVTLIGLISWLRGGGTAVDGVLRLVGPYFSANQAALYLERSFFLGLGLIWTLPAARRWLGLGCGLILLALLLTASRGALLLGLPAGLLVWGWGVIAAGKDRAGGKPHLRWRWLLPVTVLLILAGWWLWPLLGARLTNSATVLQRLTIWQSSLALWHDYFWLGIGPDGFFWRYPAYLPLGALDEPNLHHPHNLWLTVVTGWGVAGLLWLGLLLWWLARRLRQWCVAPDRWLALALLAAWAAALAHGQVDATLTLPDLALWSWLTLALLDSWTVDSRTVRQSDRRAVER